MRADSTQHHIQVHPIIFLALRAFHYSWLVKIHSACIHREPLGCLHCPHLLRCQRQLPPLHCDWHRFTKIRLALMCLESPSIRYRLHSNNAIAKTTIKFQLVETHIHCTRQIPADNMTDLTCFVVRLLPSKIFAWIELKANHFSRSVMHEAMFRRQLGI